MTKTQRQKIFRAATVDRMRIELRSGKTLSGYFKVQYPVKEADTLPSTIETIGKIPTIKIPKGDVVATDIENAIILHEYYKILDETQASDSRLWAYLAHVEFREYTLARWGLRFTPDELEQDQVKKMKATNYLFEHWFIGGNDRDLRRHAIARLWWAAHLTYEPWVRDPEFFGDLKHEDPYHYTRILFFTQDIYQQVLERAMGRSDRILILILDYLSHNKDFAESREKVRTLMKELNLAYGTKKLIALDRLALTTVIERIAEEVGNDSLALNNDEY